MKILILSVTTTTKNKKREKKNEKKEKKTKKKLENINHINLKLRRDVETREIIRPPICMSYVAGNFVKLTCRGKSAREKRSWKQNQAQIDYPRKTVCNER